MTASVIAHGAVVANRYELIDRRGTTAMAHVWKALDLKTGEHVAVKFQVLSDEILARSDAVEIQAEFGGRFHQEAGLLGEFDHPGIPAFRAAGKYRGVPYFVMEFIDGATLHELHGKRRPLPIAAIAAIAVRAAHVLQHAHARRVVHRDLKPTNIMIATDGTVKIIDFGIAKNLSAGAVAHTLPGATLGSIGYQAPEQIEGYAVTPATDVYALGCVLYDLFVLHPPFPGQDGAAVQRQHLRDPPCPASALTNRITPELDDVLLRMLAKRSEDRPDLGEVIETFKPRQAKPGDPAPVPTLEQDPTLPDRLPDGQADARPTNPAPAPSTPEKPSAWLSVRELAEVCDQVEAELATGVPGPAARQLLTLAPRARRQLGSAKPVVVRALKLAEAAQAMLADRDENAPETSPPPSATA
jgi:eukaryotic-like serine/threonine-protein kinase